MSQVTLWNLGSRLSDLGYAALTAKYNLPVVSSFNYYLQFQQQVNSLPYNGGTVDINLNSITGLVSQLLIYYRDDRANIAYPGPGNGSTSPTHKLGNLMTLPLSQIQLIKEDGSIFGSGNVVSQDLRILFDVYKETPVSTSYNHSINAIAANTPAGNDELYFRKAYKFDFANFPIEAANKSIFSGVYSFTGRERLRIAGSQDLVNIGYELDANGNAIDATPSSALYSQGTLCVVAYVVAEAVESNGTIYVNIPRTWN
jgi:hypothetical protein